MFKWNSVIDRFNIIVKLKLTILILVKNNAKWQNIRFIFNTIEVLYKDLLEFEFFIYENNSTDMTKTVVHKFMKYRNGLFICETIKPKFKWKEGIDQNEDYI